MELARERNEATSALACAACEHSQEAQEVFIIREEAIAIEVDAIAAWGGACPACEHREKAHEVLIVRKEPVVVEVDIAAGDGVARDRDSARCKLKCANEERWLQADVGDGEGKEVARGDLAPQREATRHAAACAAAGAFT